MLLHPAKNNTWDWVSSCTLSLTSLAVAHGRWRRFSGFELACGLHHRQRASLSLLLTLLLLEPCAPSTLALSFLFCVSLLACRSSLTALTAVCGRRRRMQRSTTPSLLRASSGCRSRKHSPQFQFLHGQSSSAKIIHTCGFVLASSSAHTAYSVDNNVERRCASLSIAYGVQCCTLHHIKLPYARTHRHYLFIFFFDFLIVFLFFYFFMHTFFCWEVSVGSTTKIKILLILIILLQCQKHLFFNSKR